MRTTTSLRVAERGAQHLQQRDAALEHRHERVDLREVLEAVLVQQPRGAVDVERVLGGGGEVGERGHEAVQERALAVRQRRIGEAGVQLARAEAEAGELLVEELRRPRDEAAVDGRRERQHALGDAAGRGDDHDHHDLRLQQQHLDVADRRGVQRRRGDDREQVRDLRQRLGRGPHRLVDLAAGQLELERDALRRLAGSRRSTK